MELIADRFSVTGNGQAIDLATGRIVSLVESSAGGATEQARWSARCDRFLRLRHADIAALVDFGIVGEMRRFEAWDCTVAPSDAATVDHTRSRAHRFLRACGWTVGCLSTDRVGLYDSVPVLCPGAETGHEAASSAEAESLPLASRGLSMIARRAVAMASEVVAHATDDRPRFVSLWGPPGSGVKTAVLSLARVARQHGFVPVRPAALRMATEEWKDTLRGRSLFLIVEEDPRRDWGRTFEWLLRSPRPHVVLFAGRHERPHVEGLRLETIGIEDLIRAVIPEPRDGPFLRSIEMAARRAKGNPGRFGQILWEDREAEASHDKPSKAAESCAPYGATVESLAAAMPANAAPWPSTAELQALRQRIDSAGVLLQRGRHEPGCRLLRQAIGSLIRRHDWEGAARGGLLLARAFARRGRCREAQTACSEARALIARLEPETPLWTEAALLSGIISTDLGRLDEADHVLTTLVTAARAAEDTACEAPARLALARCLFWRARYDDALRVLTERPCVGMDAGGAAGVLARAAVVRIAVGRDDAGAGLAGASGALELARRSGSADLIARASCASAFAYAAVGDRTAMQRDIDVCVNAARTARDPVRAMKARLIGAEYACRIGDTKSTATLVARLSRVAGGSIPGTVRARLALLADLGAGDRDRQDAVARHQAASGLPALSLYADGLVATVHHTDRLAVADALEMLRCCQTAEDPGAVLAKAVGHLRQRFGAVAIACISPQGVILAADGRMEHHIAARVLAAGQTIAPHQCNGSVEGGAPVKYGGDVMAALVGRWAVGALRDPVRVALALPIAATIVAPAVAELVARGRQAPSQALGEIAGISDAIGHVRQAIERAANAPFPVLVEGESGCGKELVARALHRHGARRARPFCGLNCAAMPDDLLESELFGHTRGAFTGAVSERPGVFEEAHTGTLFLDEVGELSARAQAKLLRTLQEGEVRRVGENSTRKVDVRIVAATNRNLRAEVAAGRFRRDLLYRLDVLRIAVPPLRDRREDIAVLAERFWRDSTDRVGSKAVLSSEVLAALSAYDWPGNVRELQNVLASLAVRSPRRGLVPLTALPTTLSGARHADPCRLDTARRAFEERFVRAALVRTGGHRLRAAVELGVTRQGLAKLMTRLGISEGGSQGS